jgi:excinuclease ABC subunit C
MRNEAHRFSINHHRNKRSKALIKSELENIPGIGPKTKALLFQEFKTIESIKKATKIQLSDIIGTKKATIVVDYFVKNQSL